MPNPCFVVTGGAGFIGSNLVRELVNRYEDHKVYVIDDLSHGDVGNLPKQHLDSRRIELIDQTINYEQPLDQLPIHQEISAIFHMAAVSNTSADDFDQMRKANVLTTSEIAIAARSMGVPLIYASSAGVYGNGPTPMGEGQDHCPLSLYAQSKSTIDKNMEIFLKGGLLHLDGDSPVVGLRYFNVYGPGEWHKKPTNSCSPVLHFYTQILFSSRPDPFVRLYDGSQEFRRDFIYVDDAVEATILAYEKGVSGIFNVGTGTSRSFTDVLAEVEKHLGSTEIQWTTMPEDMATRYQFETEADTSRAEKELGFKAKLDLESGVLEYINQLQQEDSNGT